MIEKRAKTDYYINMIQKELADDIVQSLKTLEPDKIILFGSYAADRENEDSDIDLCLIKDVPNVNLFSLKARKKLRDIILSRKIGFDIITVNDKDFSNDNAFYTLDIMKEGKVLYAK